MAYTCGFVHRNHNGAFDREPPPRPPSPSPPHHPPPSPIPRPSAVLRGPVCRGSAVRVRSRRRAGEVVHEPAPPGAAPGQALNYNRSILLAFVALCIVLYTRADLLRDDLSTCSAPLLVVLVVCWRLGSTARRRRERSASYFSCRAMYN